MSYYIHCPKCNEDSLDEGTLVCRECGYAAKRKVSIERLSCEEIVKRILGPTYPLGEHGADAERLQNVRRMTALVDDLLNHLRLLAKQSSSSEASVRAIGDHAKEFLRYLADDLGEEDGSVK